MTLTLRLLSPKHRDTRLIQGLSGIERGRLDILPIDSCYLAVQARGMQLEVARLRTDKPGAIQCMARGRLSQYAG